ncbi:hypothetical protein LPJ73_006045, partial [Coemansia sp. RSA 2703]
AFTAIAYSAVIIDAKSNVIHTEDRQVMKTVTATVETNLSHFIPQMLSEAREIEREAMAMGFEEERSMEASPTAAAEVTVDLFVDEKLEV